MSRKKVKGIKGVSITNMILAALNILPISGGVVSILETHDQKTGHKCDVEMAVTYIVAGVIFLIVVLAFFGVFQKLEKLQEIAEAEDFVEKGELKHMDACEFLLENQSRFTEATS